MFDIATSSLVLSILGTFVPLGISLGCSIAWWKKVQRPWIFLILSVLAMSAVYSFLSRIFHLLLQLGIVIHPSAFAFEPSVTDPYPFLRIEIGLALLASILSVLLGYLLLRAAKSAQLRV
ncbi:hypothetical protein H8K35_10410 [Undibacterium sp. LX40W]|uniref:Uncharacterized protein n=1 Tax=Undibacterium nitidum TaxID=2762298 RepID=A0A923HSW1_9BURK|nr:MULTISPECIES: hypothetical protein [Undibacterium]MBC3881932.1 hypothetical protein [Undibacterium nitidum]MBC3892071.1 hypothetical protein [Undibacterium sp. LX40W]